MMAYLNKHNFLTNLILLLEESQIFLGRPTFQVDFFLEDTGCIKFSVFLCENFFTGIEILINK